jgi:hypothetical protein
VLTFSGERQPLVMAVEARDDKLDQIKVSLSCVNITSTAAPHAVIADVHR